MCGRVRPVSPGSLGPACDRCHRCVHKSQFWSLWSCSDRRRGEGGWPSGGPGARSSLDAVGPAAGAAAGHRARRARGGRRRLAGPDERVVPHRRRCASPGAGRDRREHRTPAVRARDTRRPGAAAGRGPARGAHDRAQRGLQRGRRERVVRRGARRPRPGRRLRRPRAARPGAAPAGRGAAHRTQLGRRAGQQRPRPRPRAGAGPERRPRPLRGGGRSRRRRPHAAVAACRPGRHRARPAHLPGCRQRARRRRVPARRPAGQAADPGAGAAGDHRAWSSTATRPCTASRRG